MSISSHLGIVLLVIVGMATVIGVIIIATIEARRYGQRKTIDIAAHAGDPAGQKKG